MNFLSSHTHSIDNKLAQACCMCCCMPQGIL